MYMYKNFVKRVLDVVFSLILIILLIPLFLIISLLIKLEDGGPVFFKQLRSGKNKDFMMYKFRSMKINNDVHNLKKMIVLQKLVIYLWKYFTTEQMRRLDVLPGITGLAQASGRNAISIIEKIDLDVEYVDNISFLLDLKIIFMTIGSIFNKKGNNSDKFAIQNELDVLKNQWKAPVKEKKPKRKCKEKVLYN